VPSESLKSLSVTLLHSKNYPAVMKVLKNHTKKKQFFLQFFNPLPSATAGRESLTCGNHDA